MADQHDLELRDEKARLKRNGKEKRKILLLVDTCSAHKKFPELVIIVLLFIMARATFFLQVSSINLNNYNKHTIFIILTYS